MLFRGCQRVLIKGRPERSCDNGAVFLADAGQRIAHEVDAAALDGSTQHFGGCGLQALMFIRDDQFDTAKATVGQSAQEFIPEHLGFAGLDGDPQYLAPPVHCPAGYCAAMHEREY